jgi:hypothetical protein
MGALPAFCLQGSRFRLSSLVVSQVLLGYINRGLLIRFVATHEQNDQFVTFRDVVNTISRP